MNNFEMENKIYYKWFISIRRNSLNWRINVACICGGAFVLTIACRYSYPCTQVVITSKFLKWKQWDNQRIILKIQIQMIWMYFSMD